MDKHIPEHLSLFSAVHIVMKGGVGKIARAESSKHTSDRSVAGLAAIRLEGDEADHSHHLLPITVLG